MKFHLIANSHLDPVWLWDWREGLNEAISTVRTVLDLMDEDETLTYMRGESVLYQHIEGTDPATFQRVLKQIEKGRWEVVGGTYLQPDTNLAGVETLARHYTEGLRYFQSRLGRRVTAAWQADSFGHTAGLPEVLAAAGMDSFAFTRPDNKLFPLTEPAFWWEGSGGARILAYRPLAGWYGAEHDEIPRRFDSLLEAAQRSRLKNVGCFYGLGNHGGGPTRRHLAEIREWARKHPEVTVVHSGLHSLFAAVREELKETDGSFIPTHRGELNFCLRGCYSSQARFKSQYRSGENRLARAEKTDAIVAGFLGTRPADLSESWRGILFNSFHDILPGTSIERAFEDQSAWMGSVLHKSQQAEFNALNHLAQQIDTAAAAHPEGHPSGVAALVWNPHPQPFEGHVELETCLDYRPVWPYRERNDDIPLRVLGPQGKPLPFQAIDIENRSMVNVPWRKRVLVPVTVPSFGWNVIELGWVEGAAMLPIKNPVKCGPEWIDNGEYRVEAAIGGKGIHVFRRGEAIFGAQGMTVSVWEDPWGAWGGMTEEPDSTLLKTKREDWSVTEVKLLEAGPQRAKLWVRMSGSKSHLDLAFSVTHERSAVDVQSRLFWADRSARLKMHFPVGDQAEFEVPGATVKRSPCGEVPGGKWVSVNGRFGLVSDALYNFDCCDGVFSATVVRGTRYADDVPTTANEQPWLVATDQGEHKFNFLFTTRVEDLPRLSYELEQPPVVLTVPAKKGKLGRIGSLAALQPAELQLLALKPAEKNNGFILRVQVAGNKPVQGSLDWLGMNIPLGTVTGGQIVTWHLQPDGSSWSATRVDLAEKPLGRKNASSRKMRREKVCV